MGSPADFDRLCVQLPAETGESLSVSTVKRIWGYVPGYATVRLSTLNILSQFVGFRDWQDFCQSLIDPDGSSFPDGDVVAMSALQVGDCVEVTWSPGRRIVAQYLGQGRLRVVENLRSRLVVGSTFSCNGIVNGEQLTLTQVELPGADCALTYMCGKHGGVTAHVLTNGGQ